jgi:hypothetical protein
MSSPSLSLNWPQTQAFQLIAPRTTIALPWGRGVGKSWFLENMSFLQIAQRYGRYRTEARRPFTGTRVTWLMPTLKQFKDVHGAQIRDLVENDWAFMEPQLDRTTWRITFGDGSWMQPFPAEAAHSKSSRGLRTDVLVMDEADDIAIQVFHAVAKPWFSEPWSLRIILGGGTPRRGRKGLLHHLHTLGRSQDPQFRRYHSVHATYRDAPETVDRDAVEDARLTTPASVFKREWECDFDAAEGLVYPEFDERFHVRDVPEHTVWSEILIGADHGYEDPGVLLLIGVLGHGSDAVLWVLDEVYRQHQTEDWWCDKLAQWIRWYPSARVYADPSRPDRVRAFREKSGANTQQTDNAIQDGVAAVAARLTRRGDEARLYVSPKCKKLIWEFGSYKRRPDAQNPDQYTDEIVDRDNHAMDALRYPTLSRFGALRPARRRVDSYEGRE